MTHSQPLAVALVGIAVVCRGIQVHDESGWQAPKPKPMPFLPARDAIMVYSRGKTGTTSLQYAAGSMMEPPCKVVGGLLKDSLSHRATKCHHWTCAVPFVNSRPEGSRTWVITSNRNPFARIPSAMFQSALLQLPKAKILKMPMSELQSLFHSGGKTIHGYPQQELDWFKTNFHDAFGVDITSHKFNFDEKLLRVQHVFNNRTLEILVVRLEDSDQWKALLKPFFPNIDLSAAINTAEEKGDAFVEKYKEFLGALQYTDDEVEHTSQSDELVHFYTREEKERFVQNARFASSRRLLTMDENFWLDDPGDLPQC